LASINVKIFPEEKDAIVRVLQKHEEQTISVAAIANEADFNPNRTRFIVEELLDEGRIRKIPTKMFNARYIRYKYEVVQ